MFRSIHVLRLFCKASRQQRGAYRYPLGRILGLKRLCSSGGCRKRGLPCPACALCPVTDLRLPAHLPCAAVPKHLGFCTLLPEKITCFILVDLLLLFYDPLHPVDSINAVVGTAPQVARLSTEPLLNSLILGDPLTPPPGTPFRLWARLCRLCSIVSILLWCCGQSPSTFRPRCDLARHRKH